MDAMRTHEELVVLRCRLSWPPSCGSVLQWELWLRSQSRVLTSQSHAVTIVPAAAP
jgi:hypothetical protein